METIIASLVSSIVTLLVALFAVGPKLKSVSTQIDTHEKDSCTRKTELSKEHDNLAKDLHAITGTVTYLKEGRIADEVRRESMKGQVLDSQKALDVINASLSHMAELEKKLEKAENEITALKKENAELRSENASLHQELLCSEEQEEEDMEQ